MVLLGRHPGAIMTEEMGSFRVNVEVENPSRPGERREVRSVLVDTGAELSWLPANLLESLHIERYREARFRQGTVSIVERWIGTECVHVSGMRTSDGVVLRVQTDLVSLGLRTLQEINFLIDQA